MGFFRFSHGRSHPTPFGARKQIFFSGPQIEVDRLRAGKLASVSWRFLT